MKSRDWRFESRIEPCMLFDDDQINNYIDNQGRISEGARGRTPPPPPSGIRLPADSKGPPFDTFSEIHFWPTDPKIFLKAPLTPLYTNFEGECAPKKTRFFCQNFSKSAQKRLFFTVFSKICLRRRKFCKNRGKTVLWESSKNLFGRPKKKVKIFENPPPYPPPPPPPPRENPRSAPVDNYVPTTEGEPILILTQMCGFCFNQSTSEYPPPPPQI